MEQEIDDIKTSEKIQQIFQQTFDTPGLKTYRLKFKILQKLYETILEFDCENISGKNPGKKFWLRTKSNTQNCIYTTIIIPIPDENGTQAPFENYEEEPNKFDSMIQANSTSRGCFSPILVSNRNNPNASQRIVSTDVLLILKTKLQYLIPNPFRAPITLIDLANIKNVRMTPFNILRGKAPFYQKYGYTYPNLQIILSTLPTITWGNVRSLPYFIRKPATIFEKVSSLLYFRRKEKGNKNIVTYEEIITTLTGKVYEDSTPIMEIMKQISFDMESKHNQTFIERYAPDTLGLMTNQLNLSESLVKIIALQNYTDKNFPPDDSTYPYFAIHRPESVEWKSNSAKLQLLEFEPVSTGGRLNTTRRKQKVKKTVRKKKIN